MAIAAAGAPTLSANDSLGIASVVRNSTGRYTITLQDKYMALLQVTESRELASGAPSAVGGFAIRSSAVDAATPTVVIEFVDSSGVAVELASGTTLRIEFVLKNSSAR